MTAIIVLNWNGADDTLACLQSLVKANGNFSICVVDNGSTDDSVLRIGEWITDYTQGTPETTAERAAGESQSCRNEYSHERGRHKNFGSGRRTGI